MGLDKLFFKQERIGKGGRPVTVYKLETMSGERNNHDPHERLSGKFSESKNVTPWGSILRHFGIDEIPQLLNWIRGEVQLVGFRILRKCELDRLPEDIKRYYLSHDPGLISGDMGIGRADGNLELKHRFMRMFMRLRDELERDKSISGIVKLRLKLAILAIRSYINKLGDPLSIDVILDKFQGVDSGE
jgi:lipopolysaccharide/colanic/teichoic acid biosynthesis glycosyltransferase